MSGSNIFVMYASSDGKNITVSPRLGMGHLMPKYNTAAEIEVLEGSGVADGIMTANVKCSNCESWNNDMYEMDLTASSASWIYAAKTGTPIESDSMTDSISKHDYAASFEWDLSEAQGGSDTNPFVTGGSSGGSTGGSGSDSGSTAIPAYCTAITSSTRTGLGPDGTGCPTSIPSPLPTSRPAWVDECYGYGGSGNGGPPYGPPKNKKRDDDCPDGYERVSSSSDFNSGFSSISQEQTMLLAHGVLASLVFVAIFPIGGILIRLAKFTGLIWVHAGLQMLGYLFYIIAFGMGIYMASNLGLMTSAHAIIGIILFIILLGQPVTGWLHHKYFAKFGERTSWSWAHLSWGRIAIFLGMLNGGLGIRLAGGSTGAKAAYGIIATIMALIYIAAIVMGELRRKRQGPPSYEKSQRANRLRGLNGSDDNVHPLPPYSNRNQSGDPRAQQWRP